MFLPPCWPPLLHPRCRTLLHARHHPSTFLFFSFFFNLTYSRWTSSLPSCLWSLRIFPFLPGSRLTFSYRDASSALLQLVKPIVEFYLLTFPRFPLRKKEHKFYFGKNRTHDFRTSRCAGYLLDHSGDTTAPSLPPFVPARPSTIMHRRGHCSRNPSHAIASVAVFALTRLHSVVVRIDALGVHAFEEGNQDYYICFCGL